MKSNKTVKSGEKVNSPYRGHISTSVEGGRKVQSYERNITTGI